MSKDSAVQVQEAMQHGLPTDSRQASIDQAVQSIASMAVERARLIHGSRLDSESKRTLLARLALVSTPEGARLVLNRRCRSAAQAVVRDVFKDLRASVADAIASLSLDTPASEPEALQALDAAQREQETLRQAMRLARKAERERIDRERRSMRIVK